MWAENLLLSSRFDMFRLRGLPIRRRNRIEGRRKRLFDGLELDWVGIAGGVIDNPKVVVICVRPGFRRLAKPKQLAKSHLLPAIVLLELAAGDMFVLPGDDHGLSVEVVLWHEVARRFLGVRIDLRFLSVLVFVLIRDHGIVDDRKAPTLS